MKTLIGILAIIAGCGCAQQPKTIEMTVVSPTPVIESQAKSPVAEVSPRKYEPYFSNPATYAYYGMSPGQYADSLLWNQSYSPSDGEWYISRNGKGLRY